MKYGINWGFPAIPDDLRRRVRERRRKGIPCARGTVAVLDGCTDSLKEASLMEVIANNGKRGFHWETVRVSGKYWHFVWTYAPSEDAPKTKCIAGWVNLLPPMGLVAE